MPLGALADALADPKVGSAHAQALCDVLRCAHIETELGGPATRALLKGMWQVEGRLRLALAARGTAGNSADEAAALAKGGGWRAAAAADASRRELCYNGIVPCATAFVTSPSLYPSPNTPDAQLAVATALGRGLLPLHDDMKASAAQRRRRHARRPRHAPEHGGGR